MRYKQNEDMVTITARCDFCNKKVTAQGKTYADGVTNLSNLTSKLFKPADIFYCKNCVDSFVIPGFIK